MKLIVDFDVKMVIFGVKIDRLVGTVVELGRGGLGSHFCRSEGPPLGGGGGAFSVEVKIFSAPSAYKTRIFFKKAKIQLFGASFITIDKFFNFTHF